MVVVFLYRFFILYKTFRNDAKDFENAFLLHCFYEFIYDNKSPQETVKRGYITTLNNLKTRSRCVYDLVI